MASDRRPLHVRMAIGPLALERLRRPRWWKQQQQQQQAEQQQRRREQRAAEEQRQRAARLEAVLAAREAAALAAAKREAEARMQMALFEQAIEAAEVEAGVQAAPMPRQQKRWRPRGSRAGAQNRMTCDQRSDAAGRAVRAAACVWPHAHATRTRGEPHGGRWR